MVKEIARLQHLASHINILNPVWGIVEGDWPSIHWGKKTHINTMKFRGLSRDGVGGKKLFVCFLGVTPCGGETNK